MTQLYLDSDIEEIDARIEDIKNQFSGKTILFSGACGFLGRYFTAIFQHIAPLLDSPCRLIAMDNFVTADEATALPEESGSYRFIKHNIIEQAVIDEHVDLVIHAAGIASPFYYRARPLETLDVGINGTRNMLDLAREHGAKFAFFSSSEIYGNPDPKHVPTQESYPGLVPCQGARACYDESKRVGETLCHIYHEKYGVHTNAIRPFNIYGPGMGELDYRVLPNFASRIKGNKPLKIYGSGNQTRTFCYITDAMDGFLRVVASGVPGEAYNIGNPEPEVSILDLAEATKKVVGSMVTSDTIEYPDSYPADEPQRRCPDIRKARLQLEYKPSVSLEEGLRRFYSWTDKHFTGKQ